MSEILCRSPALRIGLPHDGRTMIVDSPGGCADLLADLAAQGYRVPVRIVADLRADQADIDSIGTRLTAGDRPAGGVLSDLRTNPRWACLPGRGRRVRRCRMRAHGSGPAGTLRGAVGVFGSAERPPENGSDCGVLAAAGTVAAAAFAAVLYQIVTGGSVLAGLTDLINRAMSLF